jgi:abhydrolase domain-containing protein 6
MTLLEQTITVNGQPIHYWESGDPQERALLLLHGGWGDAQQNWEHIIPTLAQEYRIIAPDLPGFGQSGLLPDMQIATVLGWLKAFLDALEQEKVVIIGHAFGALFARLFAAAHPQNVSAVILVNGGSIPALPGFFRTLARVPVIGNLVYGSMAKSVYSRGALKRAVHNQKIVTDELVNSAATNTPIFTHYLQMSAAYPIPENQTPKVPTLLLWGVEDTEFTIDEARRIQAQIPGAQLNEVEACGHILQLEEPDVFVWQIRHFLRELDRPRRTKGAGYLPPEQS